MAAQRGPAPPGRGAAYVYMIPSPCRSWLVSASFSFGLDSFFGPTLETVSTEFRVLRVYICLSYHVGYSNYQGWRLLKFGQDETTTTSDTSTLLCTPQLHPVPRFQRSYGSFTVPWYLFIYQKRGGHSLACPGPMADVGEGDQTGTRAPNLLVSCASCPTDGLHRSRSPTKHGIGKTPCVMRGGDV